jgi:hypothetical protein
VELNDGLTQPVTLVKRLRGDWTGRFCSELGNQGIDKCNQGGFIRSSHVGAAKA